MPRKPSKERNSPSLNRTELQQGQIRRAHRTRGSQVGQSSLQRSTERFRCRTLANITRFAQ
jgi:hypothetical protein